jgi:hypothetical protein
MGQPASIQLLSTIVGGSARAFARAPLQVPAEPAAGSASALQRSSRGPDPHQRGRGPDPHQRGRGPLWDLAAAGTMVELSGTAPGKLSTVARLVARAQAEGEPVAWVSQREVASFYPPDFARVGVDLAALVVVRLPAPQRATPDAKAARQPHRHGVLRAAEVLLRSGAFGLVVVDLSSAHGGVPRGELAWQTRLSGLVRAHDARLVLLTTSPSDEPSLGPLVGLRMVPELNIAWDPERGPGGRAMLTQRVLKAKLGHLGGSAGPCEPSPDVRSLPEGLV